MVQKIRHLGDQLESLCDEVSERALVHSLNTTPDPGQRLRWALIAKTDLQKGTMCLVRAVIGPEFF